MSSLLVQRVMGHLFWYHKKLWKQMRCAVSGRLLLFCADTELLHLYDSEFIICDGTFQMALWYIIPSLYSPRLRTRWSFCSGLSPSSKYFGRTWVRGEFPPYLWTHFDNNGPRTTNAAEGWHNSLNTHFWTPNPSLRVLLHWLQKCQFEIQSGCIQLVAGRPAKQQLSTYVEVNSDLWNNNNNNNNPICKAPECQKTSVAPRSDMAWTSARYLRRLLQTWMRCIIHGCVFTLSRTCIYVDAATFGLQLDC